MHTSRRPVYISTFTFTFIRNHGKSHNHRSRGDTTTWRVQTSRTSPLQFGSNSGLLVCLRGTRARARRRAPQQTFTNNPNHRGRQYCGRQPKPLRSPTQTTVVANTAVANQNHRGRQPEPPRLRTRTTVVRNPNHRGCQGLRQRGGSKTGTEPALLELLRALFVCALCVRSLCALFVCALCVRSLCARCCCSTWH